MIKVLIVDDSLLFRRILTEILESDPEITVVGTAANGLEALKKTAKLKPDLITMDIEMPVMDGIEATEKITAEYSVPILVITSSEIKRKREVPFYAIKAGAVDIWEKPGFLNKKDFKKRNTELIRAVKVVSSITVVKRKKVTGGRGEVYVKKVPCSIFRSKIKLIGIGSSTGGPKELLTIFKNLPKKFPVPILVIQHIGKEFVEGLVRWISLSAALNVRVAKEGETVEPGCIYFAPGGYHMEISAKSKIMLSNGKPVNSCKPSIDVLFKSIAENTGRGALCILLTGMGVDGASGLLNIKNSGGKTIAQNKESSVVFGMPAKAIEFGAADEVLSVDEIVSTLKAIGKK